MKEIESMDMDDAVATNELGKIQKEHLAKIKNSWDIASTHKSIQNSLNLQTTAQPMQPRNEQSVKMAQHELGSLLGKRPWSFQDSEIQESGGQNEAKGLQPLLRAQRLGNCQQDWRASHGLRGNGQSMFEPNSLKILQALGG